MTGRAEHLGDQRLPEIVAEDREHECLVVRVAAAKIRRAVEGQHGVDPHVALRVPARILGYADERLDLGKEPHETGLPQKLEAKGGPYPEKQMFAHLRKYPLRRQLPEVELTAERQQLAIRLQLEAGRELRRSKSPEGVFREMQGVGDAEPPGGEILPAAVWIEDLAGERVEAHRIDSKVAPASRGREVQVRGDLDRESPMPRPRLVVAPREREVRIETVDAKYPERSSDRPGSSVRTEDRFDRVRRESEDFHVDIGRWTAEEAVAYLPSNEKGAPRPPFEPPPRSRTGAGRCRWDQRARRLASSCPEA